jgi:hypothetical protein
MATRFRARITRSRNDQLRTNDAWHKFYAGAADKEVPQHLLNDLPPKRERVVRPVDKRPVGPSEHQEQARVITWWGLQHEIYGLPAFALFAVPNGGARDVITGSMLKAEGVRRGALDLILAKPSAGYHGLFIEMKVGDNKPSPEQLAFIEYLKSVGYKTAVHWASDSAINEIKDYLQQ